MISSFVKRARRAFEALVEQPNWDDSVVDELGVQEMTRDTRIEDAHGNVIARGATVEDEYVQQFVVEDELVRLRRRCDEYFKIIETIEQERNEWIEMWRTQSGEHLTAQAMLERSLAATRQTAARAIMMLNKMRKAAKLEPIDKPDGLESYDGEPVGLAEDYAVRMLALRKKLGAPIDAKAARDVVDANTERALTGDTSDAADGARALDGEAAGAPSDEQHDSSADGRAGAAAQGDR